MQDLIFYVKLLGLAILASIMTWNVYQEKKRNETNSVTLTICVLLWIGAIFVVTGVALYGPSFLTL
jgi:hypothetical protein